MVAELAHNGLQKPIVTNFQEFCKLVASHCITKLTVMEQKSANATNQDFFFPLREQVFIYASIKSMHF